MFINLLKAYFFGLFIDFFGYFILRSDIQEYEVCDLIIWPLVLFIRFFEYVFSRHKFTINFNLIKLQIIVLHFISQIVFWKWQLIMDKFNFEAFLCLLFIFSIVINEFITWLNIILTSRCKF